MFRICLSMYARGIRSTITWFFFRFSPDHVSALQKFGKLFKPDADYETEVLTSWKDLHLANVAHSTVMCIPAAFHYLLERLFCLI